MVLRSDVIDHGLPLLPEAGLVECFDGVLLESVAEAVIVTVHPAEKLFGGSVWSGLGCLPRFDPRAEEISDEHPERTARVVDLFRFLVAACDKGFEELDRLVRLSLDQAVDFRFDR